MSAAPYIPHTDAERRAMLDAIGVERVEELFREIPANLVRAEFDLPSRLTEGEIARDLAALAARNVGASRLVSFLGSGIYDRFVPSTVGVVISRGEFLTAYTPYQPEASQGYLQTIYEFQTMVAELLGTDIANASMYDGGTSMAEAAIMAVGLKGKDRVAVSTAVHPRFRAILRTYAWSLGVEVVEVAHGPDGLAGNDVPDGVAAWIVQSPNFFGLLEDVRSARVQADARDALLIAVADPVACAILPPPGEQGADVVVAEGQPLGVPMGLGGPLVGFFGCRKELIRSIPGRIVGRTKEVHGDREGYVMTLRTREQDIRREKATSNICTNEALMALANTVHLASVGKQGLRDVATASAQNARYLVGLLEAIPGVAWRFPNSRYFAEAVVTLPRDARTVRDELIEDGFLAGFPLGDDYPGRENDLVVATTELRTRDEMDRFAAALRARLN